MTVLPPISDAPDLGVDDFLAALQNLLPRGRAWPRDGDANLTAVLSGIAAAWAAGHARQRELIEDAFPSTTVELLPEWEASLGLPDPCFGPNPLTSARQAAVVARFTASGGQSIAYFQALADSYGSAVTVTEYAPFRAGIDVAMTPLRCAAWAHIWLVTLTSATLFRFEAQISTAGQPLWTLGVGAVGCEIIRLKPGHTIVEFASAEGVPAAGMFQADLSLTDSLSVAS